LMELYRRLVESAPDGILIVEGDRVVFANAAAIALAGSTRAEELVGRTISDLFSPDDRAPLRR